jgi:hypothetical protein
MAFQGRAHGSGLDRGGRLEAQGIEGLEQALVQSEFGKHG